jgi:hypothetical protein
MILDVETILDRADKLEQLATMAPSNVLRCRYLSMARYWAILSADRSACASRMETTEEFRLHDDERVSK